MFLADGIVLRSIRREEEVERGRKISRKKTVDLRFNGDVNLSGNSDNNQQGEN